MLIKRIQKKARLEQHKKVPSYIEQILEAISNEKAAVRPPISYL